MTQDPTEDKLDKVDSYLTKFGAIMYKHWGKLLFLGLCWVVYWAFTQPEPVEAQDYLYYPAETYDSTDYLGNQEMVEQMEEYGEDTTIVE